MVRILKKLKAFNMVQSQMLFYINENVIQTTC